MTKARTVAAIHHQGLWRCHSRDHDMLAIGLRVSGDDSTRPDGGYHWGEDSMPVVLHRLATLEKRVDSGFTHLDARLDTLGFVRTDVYEAQRLSSEARLLVLEKKLAPGGDIANDILDSRRLSIWAVALFGSAIVVAVIGAIVSTALR